MKEQDEKRFAEVYHKQWKDFHIEWEGDIPYTVCDTIQMDRTNSQKNYNLFLAGLKAGREERKAISDDWKKRCFKFQEGELKQMRKLEEWQEKVAELERYIRLNHFGTSVGRDIHRKYHEIFFPGKAKGLTMDKPLDNLEGSTEPRGIKASNGQDQPDSQEEKDCPVKPECEFWKDGDCSKGYPSVECPVMDSQEELIKCKRCGTMKHPYKNGMCKRCFKEKEFLTPPASSFVVLEKRKSDE